MVDLNQAEKYCETMQIAQRFHKQSMDYDRVAKLQKVVAAELGQRIKDKGFIPSSCVDIGSGTGYVVAELQRYFPEVPVVALDLALASLQHIQQQGFGYPVCADAQRLPIAQNCCDMVTSNLFLQWLPDVGKFFKQLHKIMRPHGQVFHATFGPQTLKELRASWGSVSNNTHVNSFPSIIELGNWVQAAGFIKPVLDSTTYELTFASPQCLARYLRALGANYVFGGAMGLCGPRKYRQMVAHYYNNFADPNIGADQQHPAIIATFEVIFIHADAGVAQHNVSNTFGIPVTVTNDC